MFLSKYNRFVTKTSQCFFVNKTCLYVAYNQSITFSSICMAYCIISIINKTDSYMNFIAVMLE